MYFGPLPFMDAKTRKSGVYRHTKGKDIIFTVNCIISWFPMLKLLLYGLKESRVMTINIFNIRELYQGRV